MGSQSFENNRNPFLIHGSTKAKSAVCFCSVLCNMETIMLLWNNERFIVFEPMVLLGVVKEK